MLKIVAQSSMCCIWRCAHAPLLMMWTLGVLACGAPEHLEQDMHVGAPRRQAQRLAQATPQGRVAPDMPLTVTLGLPLRDPNALRAHIEALYDPQDPQYHSFLSPEAFAATYHPDDAMLTAVKEALAAFDVRVDERPHGALVRVQGQAYDLELAFASPLHHFVDAQGDAFVAPLYAPTPPEALDDVTLSGLGKKRGKRSLLRKRFEPPQTTKTPQVAAANAGLSAQQTRTAYNVPADITASGAVIGLFEIGGYQQSDIATYCKNNALALPSLTNVLVSGATGQPYQDFQAEVALDIELVIAMTPGISQVRVYEGLTSSNIDVLNEMINPSIGDKRLVPVLSMSYGEPEDQMTQDEADQENALLMQMVAQGQTLFAAGGDSGADADGSNLGVLDPAAQPYVVAVGGTRLKLNTDGSYQSESTWLKGGGGVSSFWPMPSYQTGVTSQASGGSTTMRNYPDVSLNSDPNTGYAIEVNGKSMVAGGTSCAAPLWASILTLTNAKRQTLGLEPLGFFNYALYNMAKTSLYASSMHDVRDKSSNGHYLATLGFDDATGWGSANVANFINAFTVDFQRRAFLRPAWMAAGGP